MSQRKESTLLTYVIAYLQEEQQRDQHYEPASRGPLGGEWTRLSSNPSQLRIWLEDALDAYARGAR